MFKKLSIVLFSMSLFSLVTADTNTPLLCYVGGTMRPAVEEIIKLYEQKYNQKMSLDFSGSGELMIKIRQTQKGDIFIAHDPYLAAVQKEGLSDKGWVLASVTPVIVVQKGNPKKIKGFKDLTRKGLKIILTDDSYSTLGHLLPRIAEKAGVTQTLEPNVVSRPRSGSEAANAVSLGTADAAIVWDAVAHLRLDKLDIVPIEPAFRPISGVDAVTSATYGRMNMGNIKVTAALLKCSKNKIAAAQFGEFLAGPEAAPIWKKFSFGPAFPTPSWIQNNQSTLSGSLFIYCAAGMRKPVQELTKAFEKESGVKIETSFDGSNKLLGQMKLTRKGDVYIAGDAEYLDMAAKEKLIGSARQTLCYFLPVMMVKKGNPKKIASLADCLRPGIRLGQGDEKAAAIGILTPRILAKNSIDAAAWKKNVVLNTPTVNELGNAVKLGTIDVALVWNCIADDFPDDGEAILLPADKNIVPPVEGATLAFSKNLPAAEAFLQYLVSDKGLLCLQNNGYLVEKP